MSNGSRPSPWSTAAAPEPGLACVVIVPARNESLLLPRALAALAAQRGVTSASYEVLLLANNCDDDTAEVARRVAQTCPSCPVHVAEVRLPREEANVGVARRMLMDEAVRRLRRASQRLPRGGVILSTDGDTRVEPDWIGATLAEIEAGADAVGGRILTEREACWTAAIGRVQRLDAAYLLLRSRLESLLDPDIADPWPRHHQHFGASLAVTVDAYRRIGGLPVVPYMEDEAMVTALRLQDARIRHSPHVRVWTSGRLDGRAEVGLSWQLGQWADQLARQEQPWVVDPRIEQALWAVRRAARRAWRSRADIDGAQPTHPAAVPPAGGVDPAWAECHALPVDAIAAALKLDVRWTRERFAIGQSFGRLWADIEQRWREQLKKPPRRVPMHEAVRDLRLSVGAVQATPRPMPHRQTV